MNNRQYTNGEGHDDDTRFINSAIAKSLDFITNLGASNKEMISCFELAQEACQSHANVLIIGENGTGKSLLAQSIHYASPMASGPCVTVDCGLLDKNLLDAELFGIFENREEGGLREGAFELAAGGTVIIDNVECLSLSTQSVLLAALEERYYRVVGSGMTLPLRTRIVSTSASDLAGKASSGLFLENLLYSLGEVTLRLPPLRKRMEDMPALLAKGIVAANQRYGKKVEGLSRTAMDFLTNYNFPGNIRELNRIIDRAVNTTSRTAIFVEDLGVVLDSPVIEVEDSEFTPLIEMEKRHITRVLEHVNWNKSMAARILHITQSLLKRKMRLHKLTADE